MPEAVVDQRTYLVMELSAYKEILKGIIREEPSATGVGDIELVRDHICCCCGMLHNTLEENVSQH